MPQYDLNFAKNLTDVSTALLNQGLETPEARRTVIYLSRLSMELSLKALLELAGKPTLEIKSRGHDLQALLADVESYEFEMKIFDDQWHSGTEIRKLNIPYNIHQIDMGTIIEAERHGASKFPNEIRYGDNVQDVAPEILTPASLILASWAHQCTGNVRRKS
ncbi:hypothetical protein [Methyloversatilis universalis]|uniref:hypothetical protein n=1 Tax=Methyloversatilis universalis TaxID=378211 RepID=UPI0012F8004C|nr:hypothetical protein [Methyloversatilis universalis]